MKLTNVLAQNMDMYYVLLLYDLICLQIMQTLNGGGVLGLLCYKLITIVNCYLETGLTCIVY